MLVMIMDMIVWPFTEGRRVQAVMQDSMILHSYFKAVTQ